MADSEKHDSADDRTLMAEERTFSAWVRTGLTSIATGLGIVKLLPQGEPDWMVRTVGAVLSVVGGMSFAFGFWGYRRGSQHWDNAIPRAVPLWAVALLSGLLMVVAGLVLWLVFVD